jgi:hypothetical protein
MRIGDGILPQLWLPALRSIELPGQTTFKEWLLGGAYSVAGLNWSLSGNAVVGFTLQIHNEHDFYLPLACEINRWSSACFESIEAIHEKPKRNHAIAWPLIQLYYSAFFGAHALCRTFGVICSQLEARHATAVAKQAALTIVKVAQPGNGFYAFSFNSSLNTVTARLLSDSHAGLWAEFNALLSRLSTDALSTVAQSNVKMDASKLFNEIHEMLRQRGANSGNWLSQIRNQLNYQKSHGVWYPYDKSNPEISELLKSVKRWQKNKANFSRPRAPEEIPQFIEATTFIIWLCRRVVTELAGSKINRRHFVERGGLDFLKHAKIPL